MSSIAQLYSLFQRFSWVLVLAFVGIVGSGAWQGCTPELVQLDPNYQRPSTLDGSASSNSDGGRSRDAANTNKSNTNEGGSTGFEGVNNVDGGGNPSEPTDAKDMTGFDAGPESPSRQSEVTPDALPRPEKGGAGPELGGAVQPPDINCTNAPSSIKQYGGLTAKKDSLFVGELGSQAANKTIYVQSPKGWLQTPSVIQADSKGAFRFLLSREGQKVAGSVSLLLFAGNSWCYRLKVNISGDDESAQLAKSVSTQTCRVGKSINLNLKIRGEMESKPLAYSSNTNIVTVSSVRTVGGDDSPSLKLTLQCRKPGTAEILVGGRELAAFSFPVKVSP